VIKASTVSLLQQITYKSTFGGRGSRTISRPLGVRNNFPPDASPQVSNVSLQGMIQPPTSVQLHIHNISFDCMKARQDRTNRVSGYIVKEATYLTDGIAAYTNFDPGNIISRGGFFILRMKLHSNVGLPPIEARCGFQRNGEGRGHVRLWLESKSEARPSRTGQASQYVKIEGFSGDLISASLRVERLIFTIAIRCKRSWDEEPGSHDVLKSEQRVHLHIHILSRPVSSIQPYQDLTELSHRTWRTHDFFSLFERTEFFLAEEQKSIRLKEEKLKSTQDLRAKLEYPELRKPNNSTTYW
jgi:hypothetical protein